jgi:uncharacterized protein
MRVSRVEFKSEGLKLVGVLDEAKKQADAAIVRAHGFTGNKDGLAGIFIEASKVLCRNGFDVLRFDFRGAGESEGRYEDMTIAEEVKDLQNAIKFMKNRGYRKIGVLGDSMGGAVAVMTYDTFKFDCLALWYPAIYLKSTILRIFLTKRHQMSIEEKGYTVWKRENGREFKIGHFFVEEIKNIDIENQLRKIMCPTLLVHGDKDSLVPCSDSVKSLEITGSPSKELIIIKGAEHGFEREGYFQDADKKPAPQFLSPAMEVTTKWFKRWLTI